MVIGRLPGSKIGGQCPWAVTGEGGQNARAAVAVRAAYTSVDNDAVKPSSEE